MEITHLSLALILFSIHITSFLCLAFGGSAPVLDISGKKLRAGTGYYILPVIRGSGGGLTLASTSNETCPLDVVQEQHGKENGLPITFKPVNPKKGVVRVSTNLNFKFSGASICGQSSTVWKLDYDELIGRYFVTSGGVEGNPGVETGSNWFKIEEYESDYKLVFCPMFCDNCKVMCRDVGVFLQDGKRRLGLSDVPFRVMFRKA
ncbi:hypothetical protein ACJIZ3_021007 [Penstemon smallii]|uniref:Uncharacterized protein n=1 Tax=Penstemon smallii TaxID=265156 RepID=A0ABD3SKG3_9LAMI